VDPIEPPAGIGGVAGSEAGGGEVPPHAGNAGLATGAGRKDAVEGTSPSLRPGDRVRVAKYGRGVVESVLGEAISVVFPNGDRRDFLREYVTRLARPLRAEALGRQPRKSRI